MTVPVVLSLLAVAVLLLPGAAAPRRLRQPGPRPEPGRRAPMLPAAAAVGCAAATAVFSGPVAPILAPVIGIGVFLLARRLTDDAGALRPADPLALAGAWDLTAACLRSGLPVAVAVRAGTDALSGTAAGAALVRCTELITLGADPDLVWQPASSCPDTAAFARAARRSAHSGTALAESLAGLAVELRAEASRLSEAKAQRAGVLIAGPLGLCFLPAFLLIGVIPVVVGLADRVVTRW